jgi:phospholipase C
MSWTTFAGLTQPPSNIANPNPTSSTSDKYVADKVFTECADTTQPGIQAIVSYLSSLPYHPAPNCETGIFYMINNLSPGFLPNGTNRYGYHHSGKQDTAFTVAHNRRRTQRQWHFVGLLWRRLQRGCARSKWIHCSIRPGDRQ